MSETLRPTISKLVRCLFLVQGSLLGALALRFLWVTRGETPLVLSSYLSTVYYGGIAIRNSLIFTVAIGGCVFYLHERQRARRGDTLKAELLDGFVALTGLYASLLFVALALGRGFIFPRWSWVAAWAIALSVFFIVKVTHHLESSAEQHLRLRPGHMLIDGAISGLTFLLAYVVRFDASPSEAYQQQAAFLVVFVMVIYVGSNYLWRCWLLLSSLPGRPGSFRSGPGAFEAAARLPASCRLPREPGSPATRTALGRCRSAETDTAKQLLPRTGLKAALCRFPTGDVQVDHRVHTRRVLGQSSSQLSSPGPLAPVVWSESKVATARSSEYSLQILSLARRRSSFGAASSFARSLVIAFASAPGSRGGTTIPVSPTIARESPTSVTTAGQPAAMPSATAFENPSEQELDTTISEAAQSFGMSSRGPSLRSPGQSGSPSVPQPTANPYTPGASSSAARKFA